MITKGNDGRYYVIGWGKKRMFGTLAAATAYQDFNFALYGPVYQ